MADPEGPRLDKDGRATNQLGGMSDPTANIGYTADPYEAYGRDSADGNHYTTPFPTGYDPYAQAPNPTQAYATYQQGYQAYPGGYAPPQQPQPGYQYQQPGEIRPLEHQPGGPKKTGLWIAIAGLVALALVAVAAVLVLKGGNDDSTTTASSGTTAGQPSRQTQPSSPRTSPRGGTEPSLPALPTIPGLPEIIEGLGTVMGSITANDGSTLTINAIGGSNVTVHTDSNTQVIAMGASKVADLKTGDTVVVQGDKSGDGTFLAKVIVSTSLNGGGFGN